MASATLRRAGAIWINWYKNLLATLSRSDDNAQGFLNKITAQIGFEYGNSNALDQDIEEQGVGYPPTGFDAGTDKAESVDILYFCGHGSRDALYLNQYKSGQTKRDSNRASNREIKFGTLGILKWFIADACQVLAKSDDPYYYCSGHPVAGTTDNYFVNWLSLFNGLRYILGFETDCHESTDRGLRFAEYLNSGHVIHEAWRMACEETEYDINIRCAYLHPGNETDAIHTDKWTNQNIATLQMTADPTTSPFVYLSVPCGTNTLSCPS